MAESDAQKSADTIEEQETNTELKYVAFIQVASLHFLAYIASIYQYAKDHSGPVKFGIHSVESTVIFVTGPIYRKFHDVPIKILKFLDREMDSLNRELHRVLPPLALDIHRYGVFTVARTTVDKLYSDHEARLKVQFQLCVAQIVQWMVMLWRLLNQFHYFHQLAEFSLPTFRYLCEKYNEYLAYAKERRYVGSRYLPIIPLEKIRKTFEDSEESSAISSNEDRSKQE